MSATFTASIEASWTRDTWDEQIPVDTLTVGRFEARVEHWGEYAHWFVSFRGAGLDEGYCGNADDARRNAEDLLREYVTN